MRSPNAKRTKVIRCHRCRRPLRGAGDGWNVVTREGVARWFLCLDCQTPQRDAEAQANEATLNCGVDPVGRFISCPKGAASTPDRVIVVGADGLPDASLDVGRLQSDAVRLAYALAVTADNPDAGTLARWRSEYGVDYHGFVCAAASTITVEHVLAPALDVLDRVGAPGARKMLGNEPLTTADVGEDDIDAAVTVEVLAMYARQRAVPARRFAAELAVASRTSGRVGSLPKNGSRKRVSIDSMNRPARRCAGWSPISWPSGRRAALWPASTCDPACGTRTATPKARSRGPRRRKEVGRSNYIAGFTSRLLVDLHTVETK